jgi:probable F420-dependent oxidoreductase
MPQYGAIFPQTEIGSDVGLIREWVQTAEDLGYDYIELYDHVLGADPERDFPWNGPYTDQHPFHEVMVTIGYMAALTTRIHFLTGILILPQRNTVVAAKQAAQLDVLSGGRLRVGVGVGWNHVEMEGIGYTFENRGQRVNEQIEVLQALWTDPIVKFDGKFHHIDRAGLNPMPAQQPIPIWFGGESAPMVRRMAKYGAGWVGHVRDPRKEGKQFVETLRTEIAKAGRDPAAFGFDIPIKMTQSAQETWKPYIDGWNGLGATHFAVHTMNGGLTPRQHIEALKDFRQFLDDHVL